MDKTYNHKAHEDKIYSLWEKSGTFKPKIEKGKKPFTIMLPPPNANAPLHLGHAMYVAEDILIRWHRMKSDPTLWVPGADHAGFETQVVYEKQLAKEGKSRFDFDRDTLYKNIWNFVQKNKSTMENQLKKLGFSLDWTKEKFTLDPDIVSTTQKTFKKLYDNGLVYREERLVNYCTKHGTAFSDLEIVHVEQKDPLYYIKYGPFVLATVRPETKFGDTAVAVNPGDKRYKEWIGKEIEVEGLLGKFKIKVIADEEIDPKFGTGVAKVTPSHDFKDFEIGKRHNLETKLVIGFDGKLTKIAGPYAGMKVLDARKKVVEDLEKNGLIDHIDENYTHTVGTCYKCGTALEPLPLPQWYVKTKPLAEKAIEVVKKGKIKIIPKRFEKIYYQWLTNIRDWNISRQIVWGIRIPAWLCKSCGEWIITDGVTPTKCECGSTNLKQDPDNFDTWFSSGQWPYAALGFPDNPDYKYFYPTSVMETGYDILFFWVARMVMLGLFVTGKIPFETVYLHGIVRDPKGQKMSKSKGNVVNPIDIVEKYGADALRISLISGAGAGNDQNFSESKITGYRNFSNKIWNISRFVFQVKPTKIEKPSPSNSEDKKILSELNTTIKKVNASLELFRFNDAAEEIYQFVWHKLADIYIEKTKGRKDEAQPTLRYVLQESLKLLHPFMPFVTETIWQQGKDYFDSPLLITAKWPEV